MKKFFALAGFCMFAIGAFAQTNLQLFYDFGSDRKMVTATLEGFYLDKWGNTFFFSDFDFPNNTLRDANPNQHSPVTSYFEIARALNFWQNSAIAPLSLHVEYNGGINLGGSCNWLFGINYDLHNADFSNTFTFELMYKTFNGGASSSFPLQFTFVWGMQDLFGLEGLRFSGFADIWGENTTNFAEGNDKDAKFIFISEPQLWYNVGRHFGCDNLNVGTEIELSANFAGCSGFKVRPCLGLKWVF